MHPGHVAAANRLVCEPIHIHMDVGGDNDYIGFTDLLLGEDVLRYCGALHLRAEGVPP